MSRRAPLWTLTALLLAGCVALCLCFLRADGPAALTLPPAKGDGAEAFAAPELPGGSVAVNHADRDELCALRGIGGTLADAIIAEREANGAFYLPEDLLCVRGIGPAKLAGFRDQLDMQP